VCFLIQVNCDVSVDTKHQTVQGVAFPLSQAAVDELHRLKAGRVNYVQLVCIRWFRTGAVTCVKNNSSISNLVSADVSCITE